MIGPASGGTARGSGAPSLATGTRGTVGAVLAILGLGLALRLIIAYLLPGSGFDTDLRAFDFWGRELLAHGPFGFYNRPFFHDYTPGYLYALWFVYWLVTSLGLQNLGDTIPMFQAFGLKIVPILCDLGIGWLVWSMIRELGGRDRVALIGAAVAVFNPISWFDSVAWGQADSVGVVFFLLALREIWRDRLQRAAVFTMTAAIIKPQLGILIPVLAVIAIRRAFWPAGGGGSDPDGPPRPIRIITAGLAGLLTALILCLPFGLSVVEVSSQFPFIRSGLLQQVAVAAGGYPYLTVNAYNLWALVPSNLGLTLANSGQWVCDYAGALEPSTAGTGHCAFGFAAVGPVPAVLIGSVLLFATVGLILWLIARRPDPRMVLVGVATLCLVFFMVPTRVHERYGYPFFALGAILSATQVRWRPAYVALSVATLANMYVVLTYVYPDNPSLRDWFGIGPALASEAGVTVIALLHGAAFVWVLWLTLAEARRPSLVAVDEPGEDDVELETEAPPTPAAQIAPSTTQPHSPTVPDDPAVRAVPRVAMARRDPQPWWDGPIVLPTWRPRPSFNELGLVGWLRSRLWAPPNRPDRTAVLASEGGGRLDRLDAWLLIVLLLTSLGLRTFRLAEPYQMKFDEVYHARTATEFLQGWRYGIQHDIYEWTHPHLAKYFMAAGLVVWGGDHVRGMSSLGVPVRDAVIEPRRTSPGSQGGRTVERLHVATGAEVRTYDLRTRTLRSIVTAPGVSAITFDSSGRELILGFDDGRLSTLDTTTLGVAGTDIGPQPVPLATVDHPISRLMLGDDGTTIVAASGDRVSLVDLASARVVGTADLPGVADIAAGGSGPALVATLAEVSDRGAVAAKLAELLGASEQTYAERLNDSAAGDTVVMGDVGDDKAREAVNAAIANGSLPGIRVEEVARVAVATTAGVTFLETTRGQTVSTIGLPGGAHGLTSVVGFDDPKLYVTAGPADDPVYVVIATGGTKAANGPVEIGSHPLPGPGTRVVYDESSQEIHILGRARGGTGAESDPWTVYVIEPHGNAVYADARLPAAFDPAAVVADIEPMYPSDDPQRLFVLDAAGVTAEIDLGSHGFAWRLPGVIAGALTTVLLYLLARILFRRRLVAGLVGLFALVDGMFLVQAQIGMNDAYVGLFVVAAYTVFAALWTGWWRHRLAFWFGLPIVGLLLGLALASKWVAAYAIGALVLLLLVRSALGRVVGILGLIAITGVLGYMAISVPEGAGFGNLTFLLLMIGLTLAAVVANVLHPIAWTTEELRVALFGPVVAATALAVALVGLGAWNLPIGIAGPQLMPLQLAALLALAGPANAVVFWLAGRLRFGPLAPQLAPDDALRALDPPAAPPIGWLRPGWDFGVPIVWAGVCLIGAPLAVYVISYVPWAMIGGHQLFPGWPGGHEGQTLLDLTAQMYRYHNDLAEPHPASSPWWAWPLNLKPVWFYQEGLAGSTAAAVYDAGNLVIWWMGVPALAFAAVMAFRRRSLALALIAIGFAAQWIPWARIDRAAFQYHYYTALPFVVLALGYFVAELWHGASRRTWLFARLAAALAIVGPAIIWTGTRPLCGFVGVLLVNPGSAACPPVIPTFVLTARGGALTLVMAVGLIVMVMRLVEFDVGLPKSRALSSVGALIGAALAIVAALVGASLLPDTPLLTLTTIPVEPIAVVIALPLVYLALRVLEATDPRRFVAGLAVAAVSWFVVLYPNIAALPLPSVLVNAYQGILPTYLYAFQFPVSTVTRGVDTPIFTPTLGLLLVAITLTCLVVAYSAWTWKVALAESKLSPDDEAGAEMDGLARSGGA